MSGEDVTGNPLDYESAVAIIVKELRPFTWNARFLAKRVLEGLGVPALLAECEARQKEVEELREDLEIAQQRGDAFREQVKEDTIELEAHLAKNVELRALLGEAMEAGNELRTLDMWQPDPDASVDERNAAFKQRVDAWSAWTDVRGKFSALGGESV